MSPPSAKAIKDKHRTDPYYELTGCNYYPTFPDITRMLGKPVSAIFGRIMSYCRMSNKNCTASQASIARDCKYTRLVVGKAIQELLEFGLIELADNNWKVGHTHTYVLPIDLKSRIAQLRETLQ